jgi:Peptidase_G2, IMC autoproteolytic cleavage domain/FG-GAP repeat/Family of unknown function (DUF6519)
LANYSRDTYLINKLKHYVSVRFQQGVPLVDADWNEMEDIRKEELHSFLKSFVGSGVPQNNDGFAIIEKVAADNDFTIQGGIVDDPGRCYVDGWETIIDNNTDYKSQVLYNNNTLASQWNVDVLAPMSTPASGTRADTVYLDTWEREINAQEDADLINPAIGIETCVRLKREWVVRVAQGGTYPGSHPQEGHKYYTLATITRQGGIGAIIAADITDLRRIGLSISTEAPSIAPITAKDDKIGIAASDPQILLAVGDDDTGLHHQGEDELALFTGNIERMRLDKDGNVTVQGTDSGTHFNVMGDIAAGAGNMVQALDKGANAQFGYAVSIDGDYAIIGANQDDEAGSNAGAAYIYEKKTGGIWTETQKLLPPDIVANDQFARSVSISGDNAIVGAAYKNSSTGAAYIYERGDDGVWVQKPKLQSSDIAAGDQFGVSVSIDGDRAIIGAQNKNGNELFAGAAYIFQRDVSGNWNQQAKLEADVQAFRDRFGNAVGISGDYAVVGAYTKESGGFTVGAAYVFARDPGGNWIPDQTLLPESLTTDLQFGISVSISGDRIIVGFLDSDFGAYIFEKNVTWDRTVKLVGSDVTGGASQFASTVSISGDWASVGAYGIDGLGAVYFFKRTGNLTWTEEQKIQAQIKETNAFFGYSVGISGNYFIAGAMGQDNGDSNSGAAHFFQVDQSGTWIPSELKGNLKLNGEITFLPSDGQFINSVDKQFGIGFQQGTQYFRAPENFAFYKQGIHSALPLDSGDGGSAVMVIKDGSVGVGTIDPGADKLDVRGRCYSSGGWQTSDADYAEYFESQNGSAIPPGTSVSFAENGTIRKAKKGETPFGIISARPAIVANLSKEWPGKYMNDDFGEPIMEEYKEEIIVEIVVPKKEDEKTKAPTTQFVTKTRRKINPKYDETKKYIPRDKSERPEWNCVGLLGQLPLRKGQPTAPQWIKIKDISKSTELWLVK